MTNAPSTQEIIYLPTAPHRRALTRNQKYHKTHGILQQITDSLIDMPQSMFETYLEEFEKCRDMISQGVLFTVDRINANDRKYEFLICLYKQRYNFRNLSQHVEWRHNK